jgi:hypothetical protein
VDTLHTQVEAADTLAQAADTIHTQKEAADTQLA